MAIQSEVKFAAVSVAASGNNTLVAAVAGKRIRVVAFTIASASNVLAMFESAADGTALTGRMSMGAASVVAAPFSPAGWFETVAGQLLNLDLSGAVSVDGVLGYVLVE